MPGKLRNAFLLTPVPFTAWKKHMPGSGVNNLVFLDESGVNTDMTRHYARSKSNERAVDSTPVNTPHGTTIVSSIRLNGKTAHTVYQGGTTAERFAEYLKDTLLPTLSADDVIVMDNMRSHHAKTVKLEEGKSPHRAGTGRRNRKGIFNGPSLGLFRVVSFV